MSRPAMQTGKKAREFKAAMEEKGRYVYARGQWFRYDGKKYRRLDWHSVRHAFWYFLSDGGTHSSRHDASEVMEAYAAISSVEQPDLDVSASGWLVDTGDVDVRARWLCFDTGLVNLDALLSGTVIQRDHTPDFFTEVLLPYRFDPAATCPLWERTVLEWLVDEEAVRFVQEYVGYLLTPDHSHQIGLFLEGSGANGKSQFCNTVKALLGPENVSAVPLEEFGDRFNLIATLGKLVNISTETGTTRRMSEGIIKQFISGDPMKFEQKGEPIFTQVPTARLLISWNMRPRFHDPTNALWRRIKLVKFPREFRGDKDNRQLFHQLKQELPGIFNWAVAGLRSLRARGYPLAVGTIEKNTESLRNECDSVQMFCSELLEHRAGSSVLKNEVHRAYREFCEARAEEPLEQSSFFRRVYDCMGIDPDECVQRSGPNRARCLMGIALRVSS